MRSLRGVIAACVAVSCTPPPAPVAPRTPPPVVKHYGPLQFAADARTPGQLVILGTDDHDGSTVLTLPLPASPPSSATPAPSPAPPPATVTFTAAHLVVADLVDKNVTDVAFAPPPDGSPALVAATLVAALLGTPVDPGATVIGGARPDGTLAPADGAPAHGLAGKKHLGVAPGTPGALAAAKQRGVDAVEVADVATAYQLLTARPLLQPVPVGEAELALDAAATQPLDAPYRAWQQKVAGEWSAIVQLESAGRLPARLATLRDRAKRAGEQAEQLRKRGLGGAAYARMLAAWQLAWTANRTYDLLARVQAGDAAGATTTLAQLAASDARTTELFDRVGERHPTTLAGDVQMLAAFEAALARWALQSAVPDHLASATALLDALSHETTAELGAPRAAEQIVDALVPTLLAVARAQTEGARGDAQLALDAGPSVDYTPDLPALQRLATITGDVAAAELHAFEAGHVAPVANDAAVSPDAARALVTRGQPELAIATVTPPAELAATWGDASLPAVLLAVARADLAYRSAAELAVPHDAAGLAAQLAAADRATRAAARAARVATGGIPVPARLAYQLASVERTGDLADQLDALARFGEATAFCRAAVMLARN